ncbi:cytoplasmic protein [Klebsiella grimontii]|uniref:Cytoplasmic protein n=1 Tax=Klebsiella grimontii TaxID=2058152 RepID=A0A7H4P4G7_9ENTR|nr:cytoplasmic protein [Klebsiella grimontii]
MITYDRNRNPITNGSQVMINGTGKTGKIIAIHSTGLTPASCVVIRPLKLKGLKGSSNRLN